MAAVMLNVKKVETASASSSNTAVVLSDDMADCCKTLCKICELPFPLTVMRNHTLAKHGLQITRYKEIYGKFVVIEPRVFHKCHICDKLVLLDHDTLGNHIKRIHKMKERVYNEQYMTYASYKAKVPGIPKLQEKMGKKTRKVKIGEKTKNVENMMSSRKVPESECDKDEEDWLLSSPLCQDICSPFNVSTAKAVPKGSGKGDIRKLATNLLHNDDPMLEIDFSEESLIEDSMDCHTMPQPRPAPLFLVPTEPVALYVDRDAGSTVPWLSPSCLPLVQRSESFVVTGGDRGTVCLPTSLLAALSPLVRDLQEFADPSGHILIPSAEEKELVVIRQILTSGCSHKEVEEELFGKVQSVLALLQIKINLVRVVLGNLEEGEIMSPSKVKKEERWFDEDEDVREESSIKGEYVEGEELSSSSVKKEKRGYDDDDSKESSIKGEYVEEGELSSSKVKIEERRYEGDDGEESNVEGEYVEEGIFLSSIVKIEERRFEDVGENPDLVSEDIDWRSSTNNEQNLLNNSNKNAETDELPKSETEDSESFAPPGNNTSNVPQVKMRRLVVQMRRLVVPNSTPNKTMMNLINMATMTKDDQVAGVFKQNENVDLKRKVKDVGARIAEKTVAVEKEPLDKKIKMKVEAKCPECDFKCFNEAELKTHQMTTHGQAKRMKMCGTCPFTCNNVWEMDFHCRSRGHKARKEEGVPCKKCDYICIGKEDVWNHKKEVHIPADKLFECGDCPWCGDSLYTIRYHAASQDHKMKGDYEAAAMAKAEAKGPKELAHYKKKLARDIKIANKGSK